MNNKIKIIKIIKILVKIIKVHNFIKIKIIIIKLYKNKWNIDPDLLMKILFNKIILILN